MWCFIDKNCNFFIACLLLLLFNLHASTVTCSSSEELVFKSLGHGVQVDNGSKSDSKSDSAVLKSAKRVKKQISLNNLVPSSNLNITDGNERDAETLVGVGVGVGIEAQEEKITQKHTHTLTVIPLSLDHNNDTGSASGSNNISTGSSTTSSSSTLSIAPSRVNGKPTMTVTATRIGMTRYFSPDPNPNPNPNMKSDNENENDSTASTSTSASATSPQQNHLIITSSPSPVPTPPLLGEKMDDVTILDHMVTTTEATMTTTMTAESLTKSPEELEHDNENDVYVDLTEEDDNHNHNNNHNDEDENIHVHVHEPETVDFFHPEDSSEETQNLILDPLLNPLNSISSPGDPKENNNNNNNNKVEMAMKMTVSSPNIASVPVPAPIIPKTTSTTNMNMKTAVDSLDSVSLSVPKEEENRAGNEMTGMSLNIQKDGNSFDASGKEEEEHEEHEGEEEEDESEEEEEPEREKVAEMEIEMNDWDLYKPVDLNALHTLSSPKINPNPHPVRMRILKESDNEIARAEELPDPVPLVSSSTSSTQYNRNNNNHHQNDGPHEEDFADAFSRNNPGHMPRPRRRRLRTNSNSNINSGTGAGTTTVNNQSNDNGNGNGNPHPSFIRRRVRKMRVRKLNDTFPYTFFPGGSSGNPDPEDEILRHFHNQPFGSPVGEASEINSFNIHTSTENPNSNAAENTKTNTNKNETSTDSTQEKKSSSSKLRENLAKLSKNPPRMRRFRSTTTTAATTSTTPMTPIIDTDFKAPAFISDFTITEIPPPSFSFPDHNQNQHHQHQYQQATVSASLSGPGTGPGLGPAPSVQPILLKSPRKTEIIPYGVDKDGNPEYIITATENPEPQIERPNIGYTEKSNVEVGLEATNVNSISDREITTIPTTSAATIANILQRKRKKMKGKTDKETPIPIPIRVPRPVFVPSTTIIPPVLSKSSDTASKASQEPSTVHNNETGEWLHSDHSKHHDMIPHHFMDLNNQVPGPDFLSPPDRNTWEQNYMNLQQHSFASGESGIGMGSVSNSGPLELQLPMPGDDSDQDQEMEVIVHREPTISSVVDHHYDAMGVPMPAPPNQEEEMEISLLQPQPQSQQPQPFEQFQSQSGPFYASGSHSNKLTIGGRPKLIFGNGGEVLEEQEGAGDGGEEEPEQMSPFISVSGRGSAPGNRNRIRMNSHEAGSSSGSGSNGRGRGSSASSSSSSPQSFNPYHTSAEVELSPYDSLPHFDTPIMEHDASPIPHSHSPPHSRPQSHSHENQNPHPGNPSSHYDRTKQKYIIHPTTQAALKPVLADMNRGQYITQRKKPKQKKQQQYSSSKFVRPRPPAPEPIHVQGHRLHSSSHESLPSPSKLTSNENLNGIQSPMEDHFQSMRNIFFPNSHGNGQNQNYNPNHNNNNNNNNNHNHNNNENEVNGGFPSPFKIVGAPQSFQAFSSTGGSGGSGGPGSASFSAGESESERIPKYLNNNDNSELGSDGPHTTIIHHHYHDGSEIPGDVSHDNNNNNHNHNNPPPPPPLTLPMPGLVHIPTPPSEAHAMNEVTSHRHFPPHSHSMAVQSEYEPANPPLPSGQHHHANQHFDQFVQNSGDFQKESSSEFPNSNSNSHSNQPPQPPSQGQGHWQNNRPNGQMNYRQNPNQNNNNNNNDQHYNDIIIMGNNNNNNNNNGNPQGNNFQGNQAHRQPPGPPQFQNQNQGQGQGPRFPGISSNNEIIPPGSSDYNEAAISPGEPFDFGENPSAAPLTFNRGKGNKGSEEKPEEEEEEVQILSPYSETPYVIMFPNLAPPRKLQQQQASSHLPSLAALGMGMGMGSGMASVISGPQLPGLGHGHSLDMPFASASGAVPEKLLGPGMKVVPVHPRIQMLKALANKEYQNKLEALQEQAKKPPSPIWTPYGVLIPMRQSQNSQSQSSSHSQFSDSNSGGSSSHNSFIPPPPPPSPTITITTKKRKRPKNLMTSDSQISLNNLHHHLKDEQSILNILLGTKIPPLGHLNLKSKMKMKGGKLSKEHGLKASLEPAMDLLAEKLAVKLSALEYLITHPPKSLGLHVSNKLHPQSTPTEAKTPNSASVPSGSVYNSHYEPETYHAHQETSYSELKPVKASIGQGQAQAQGRGIGQVQEQEQNGNKKNKSGSSSSKTSASTTGKGNKNDKGKKPFPSSPAPVHTVNKLKVNAPFQNQHLQHSNFETGAGRKQEESSSISSSGTPSSASSPSPLFSNYLKSLLKDRLFEMLEESYPTQTQSQNGDDEEAKNGTSKKSSSGKTKTTNANGKSTKTTTPLPIPSHPFASPSQPKSKSQSHNQNQNQVRRKENFPSFFGPAPAPALGLGLFGSGSSSSLDSSKIQFGPFTFPNLRRQNKKNPNPNSNPNSNPNANANPDPNQKKNRQLNFNENNGNNNPKYPILSQVKQQQKQQQQTKGGILNAFKRLFSFGNGQNQHNNNQNHHHQNGSQILRGKNQRGRNGNGNGNGNNNANGMINRNPPRNKNPHHNGNPNPNKNPNPNLSPNQNPNQNQQQNQHQHQHFENNLVKEVSPFIKSTREIEKMLRVILKNSPFHSQLDASNEKTQNPKQQQKQYYHSHYTNPNPNQKQGTHFTNPNTNTNTKAMFQSSSHPKWSQGTHSQSMSSSFSHEAPVALKVITAPQLSPSTFLPLQSSRSSSSNRNRNSKQQNVMSKRMDEEEILDSLPMSPSPLLSLSNNYPFNLLPTLTSWKPMPTSSNGNGNGNNNNNTNSVQTESNLDSGSDSDTDTTSELESSLNYVIQDFIPIPGSHSSSKETGDSQNDAQSPSILNTTNDSISIKNNNNNNIYNNNNSSSIKIDLLVNKLIPEQATSISSSTVLHKIQPRSV